MYRRNAQDSMTEETDRQFRYTFEENTSKDISVIIM